MKAKKLLGSVALTAALAMGTMPAFASVPGVVDEADSTWLDTNMGIGGKAASTDLNVFSVTGDQTDDANLSNIKKGTGQTQIKASVFDADVNVTVPMVVSVAFSTQGGTLTCPSATAYKISNNSDQKDVKLTHILAAATSKFNLVSKSSISNPDMLENNPYMLYLGMNLPGTTQAVDLGSIASSSGKLDDDVMPVISKATTNGPGTLALGLEGETNKFATPLTSAGYLADTLATLTYTVEVVPGS